MDKLDRNPGNQRLKSWRYLTEFAIRRGIVSTRATEGALLHKSFSVGFTV
jgi:hypothetical protein